MSGATWRGLLDFRWVGFVATVGGNLDYVLCGGTGTFQCGQMSSGWSGADGHACSLGTGEGSALGKVLLRAAWVSAGFSSVPTAVAMGLWPPRCCVQEKTQLSWASPIPRDCIAEPSLS